jgi:1,4-alpha-glucan branching enzyme
MKLSQLTPEDLYLFNEGSHLHLYEKLGAHPVTKDGTAGTQFAVWAPNAERVSVIGDFNGWDNNANPMTAVGASGIWQAFVPDVSKGAHYKYHIVSRHLGYQVDKTDPYAFYREEAPRPQGGECGEAGEARYQERTQERLRIAAVDGDVGADGIDQEEGGAEQQCRARGEGEHGREAPGRALVRAER